MANHKTTRFLLVFLSLLIAFTLFACSETNYPKAEESVKGFFDAMNKGDFKTAQTFCAISSEDTFKFDKEEEEKFAKLIFSKTKYEVLSSKEENGKTIVKVKLTNVDLSKVMEEVMSKAMDDALNDAFNSDKKASDESIEEKTMKYLEESISKPDAKLVSKEMDITLNKDSKKKIWVIQNDQDFINGVTRSLQDLF